MNNQSQPNRPDPAKAIVLKPHQQTRQRQKRTTDNQSWQPHQGNVALDNWGVALRSLREQGHLYE